MNTIPYKEKILLNNAYEAWYQAILNARRIKNGLVSLQYRKAFVSSLHNSVELFLKQLMLDQNDHRVATFKKTDKDGNPLKDYYNNTIIENGKPFVAHDLNVFFKNYYKSKSGVTPVISITFKELINICEEIIKPYNKDGLKIELKDEIVLLNKIRNDEEHFYIQDDIFLSADDFVKLDGFMHKFNKVLVICGLLYPFNGCDDVMNDLNYCVESGDVLLKQGVFSYKKVLKGAITAQIIAKIINGDEIPPEHFSPFHIVERHVRRIKEQHISFEDALGYIQSLFDYNLIDYSITGPAPDEPIEALPSYCVYLKIKTKI